MSIGKEINIVILACFMVFLVTNVLVSMYSLNSLRNQQIESIREILLSERQSQLRDVVQNAHSVVVSSNFYEPAQNAISEMRFGEKEQNHIFVVDTDGMFWVNPARPDLVGKMGRDLTDAHGKKYIKEILSTAAISEEGFVRYQDITPGEDKTYTKLVRYKKSDKWDWIICAGINVGDINSMVFEDRADVDSSMIGPIKKIAVSGIIAFIAVFAFISRFFRKRLVEPVKQLNKAMENCVHGDFKSNIQIRSNKEINEMGDSMQRMQNSFAVAYRKLKAKPNHPAHAVNTSSPKKYIKSIN